MNPSRNVFVFTANSSVFLGASDVKIVVISRASKYRSLDEYQKSNTIDESDDTKNLFIDVDRYGTAMEFRVMNPTAPVDSIFIKTDNVHAAVNAFKADKLSPSYDIFKGESIDKLPSGEQDQVKRYMATLTYRMLMYMSAGYHKFENTKKIDDWCVCFYDPIMLYFVHYFGIHSQCEDISIVDEFLTNAQFRHMITLELMKVVAHYAVNNKLLDVTKVHSWVDYEYKNWVSVYNQIN